MRRKGKKLAALILCAGLCIMVLAGSKLFETADEYREGDRLYEDLSGLAALISSEEAQPGQQAQPSRMPQPPSNTPLPPLSVPDRPPAAPPAPQAEVPPKAIDFGALADINEDCAAWLHCPDTVIDYPVMAADDYVYYLDHLPDGRRNANGSLFIDYNNAPDFSEALTVIYGHHMRSGRMFASLAKYKSQSYYDEHPYIYLYTDIENFRLDLIYGCVMDAGDWQQGAFMYAENVAGLLEYAKNGTTFSSAARYEPGDRIVALSTCSYEYDDARYVVLGILVPEYAEL